MTIAVPFPLSLALCLMAAPCALCDDTAWPPPNREAKPWTRWWWLGSGVDETNLTRELEAFSKAGFGGVEICPIYGAKGYEGRDLKFLSPPWTDAYSHAAEETARLGMGIDLTTGTGWPFGGPEVGSDQASASLHGVGEAVEGGAAMKLELPKGNVKVLSAWKQGGQLTEPIDLINQIENGELEWTPPPGKWKIHGLVARHGIQNVKRAAPGGAGFVLDPYSTESMEGYLQHFGEALGRPGVAEPRSHFHDSFEYYEAAWTDGLFGKFEQLRGYDLRSQLPAFLGDGNAETVARVRADYRRTMSDLHRDYLAAWHDWAAGRGSLTRNQAHGSPGNLLDHYAVADIPETEIFGHVKDDQLAMLQFAASAAHLTGRKLVSAESFTWLDEHFRVTPAMLKEAADFVWLGGINHIFFHGIPYSPEDAPWPGWLFYASTHMGPNGGLWENQPAFNSYITRVQSVLQSGEPDSPVLLYFPVHDLWQDGSEGLPLFTMHNPEKWLYPTDFHRTAKGLRRAGVPCDYVSDRILAEAKVTGKQIILAGRAHEMLIVPNAKHLPVGTARHLLNLAGEGAKIVFLGRAPEDVPGFHEHEKRRAELARIFAEAEAAFAFPKDLDAALQLHPVRRETMVGQGLRFVRRSHADGWSYFIVNRSGKAFDGIVTLAAESRSAVLLDPMSGKGGVVESANGIHLILAPGESRIIRTFGNRMANGPRWGGPRPAGEAIPLDGIWKVTFLRGGPDIPEPFETGKLTSWTEQDGGSYRNFSGTALYRLEFSLQEPIPALLDLGEIAYTAKVRLNGREAGTCWSPPHTLDVTGLLKQGQNVLEVEVTNLAANRIADLDRRKVSWKAFHEINFVNVGYKSFDASGWSPMASGLLGPVSIIPVSTN